MRKVLLATGVAVVGVAIVWWILRGRGDSDTTATTPVTQNGSNVQVARNKVTSDSPAQLVVTVTDAKGPLAGARVRIAPKTGEVTVLETKADGTASSTLPPGSYAVAASAKDHEPSAAPDITLEPGEPEKVTIQLAAGGRSLSGTVTDVSGGPIAGARIDAAKLGGRARPDAAVATAITGADGKYAMTVSEGQLLVAARSPDYSAQSRYVDVGSGGATADFSLVPGGVIEGVVIDDRSKQPVAGAFVAARRDSPSIMLAEGGIRVVTAGPDGRFRIAGLRPGAYELDAKAEGRRTRSPTSVGLGVAEQVTDVQLLVGRTPLVSGVVIDEDKAPVPNARVVTFATMGEEDVKTNDKGEFVLDGLGAGSHMLIAIADTHVIAGPTPVTIADKDLDGVVIRMQKAGKLVGHVEPRQAGCDVSVEVDDDGPMRPMMFAMAGGGQVTDADGKFEIKPITPAKLQLAARCASGDQGKVEVAWTRSTGDVAVAVAPGGSIAGKLVDGEGKPVAGATVAANPLTGTVRTTIVNGMVTSGIQGITSATGTYELRGLQPGKYRMTALDRGRPLRPKKDLPTVTLAAAEKKTGVDLAVDRPNGVIKGVVTGPDGKPLADAWVSVHEDLDAVLSGAMGLRRPGPGPGPGGPGDDDDSESRSVMVQVTDDGEGGGGGGSFPPALTDAQGRFEITGLPHLSFDVIAEAQAGKLRGRSEGVTPDANLTIKTLGLTSLSGTVRSAKGPASLFTVTLEGPTATQRTFTDGTFSLGRVDPGNYVVRVSSSDGNAEVKTVVSPNTPTNLDISLVANAIVIGTVVGPTGKPVPDVPVAVIDDTGGPLQVRLEGPPPMTGPDGKFRIERKAGKAILLLMGAVPPVTKRVELEEGKTFDAGALQLASAEPPK